MKNFFKKLSFVLASAMVITSLHAPASAEAAAKNFVRVKGSKKAVASKAIFVGGKKVNFDYTIGKKMKGVAGTWMSSDKSVATVDKKTGVVTAVGNGEATITFKTKKTKKMKALSLKTKVMAYTRAESVMVDAATDAAVKVGKTLDVNATLKAIAKAGDSKSTYNVFAESDSTAAAVKVDGMKITVEGKEAFATPATITVYAAQKNDLEAAMKDKYAVKTSFQVAVKPDLAVEQAAANKIKVVGADLATDAALYVVKNDKNVPLSIKKNVVVNEAKTEAILESEMPNILEGKYTLSYNKSDALGFEIKKAVVKEIKFVPEDKVIMTGDTTAELGYKVLDQFGNDVTGSYAIGNLNAVGSLTASVSGAGKISLTSTATLRPLVDKVSVTLVDKLSGSHLSAILEVGEKAKVASVEYKGLYNKADKKMVESIVEKETKDHVVLLALKDQYGRAYENATDIKDSVNVSAFGLGNATIGTQVGVLENVNNVNYMAYPLVLTESRQGEVTVNAICLNNGSNTSGKFNVTNAQKVNEITVTEGPKGVYNGQKNELAYTATDMDGKPVTDFNVLKEDAAYPITMSTSKGKLYFENKDGKGVLILDLTAAAGNVMADVTGNDRASTPLPLTFQTKTYKFSTVNVNVNNTRKPIAFLGLKDGVVLGTTQTAGNAVSIKRKDLRFQDQYGMEMSAADIATIHGDAYAFKVSTEDLNEAKDATVVFNYTTPAMANADAHDVVINTLANDDAEVVKATVKKTDGSAKAVVVLQLAKKDGTYKVDAAKYGEARKITLSNVSLDDVKNLTVADVKKQPAADLYNSDAAKRYYNLRPSVYGYYEGNKISLQDSEFVVYAGVAKKDGDDLRPWVAGEYNVNVPLKGSITTGDTAKAKFKVRVLNKAITEIEKEYEYSKAYPVVAETGKKNDDVIVGENVNWTTVAPKFDIKDQYGRLINVKPYVTFVLKDADLAKIENKKVMNNGTLTSAFKITGDGEIEVTVKFSYPGSSHVYEGKIKVKKA